MRKKFVVLLGTILMLSGCSLSDETDIPEYETAESLGEKVDYELYTDSQGGSDGAPAGVSPEIPSYAETDANGGVSLLKGEYDNIRELVSFDGEFVPFEELGFGVYECRVDSISESALLRDQPDAADKELLYFFEFDYWGNRATFYDEVKLLNVYEYNLLTGSAQTIGMPEDCSGIVYIDREYILYYIVTGDYSSVTDYRYYLINRTTGETTDAGGLAEYFQIYSNCVQVRCGDYLFFTRWENMIAEYGGYDETIQLLVRYSLSRNESQVLKAAELLGAVGDEIIIAPFGSGLEQVHYTLSSVSFNASPDSLYLGGDLLGYVVPTDRSTVFGEKYEAGRIFPLNSGNIYKPIITTSYGTVIEEFLINAQAVAAVRVLGELDSAEILIVDANNKRAAAVPKYGDETDYGYIMSDGNWIYLSYYSDHRIIAINTGD